ncbi:S-layer homology domain-containing protein [Nodosilinea nodulosa]|uniref:S-layer homology domain-containing protein n=1 Tax=Nodosilinea nodulosa TaxID=416001 RepID=UPI0002F9FBDA|nr:S-layer homology domain-containing protein [Nodosilinea nodulosa]
MPQLFRPLPRFRRLARAVPSTRLRQLIPAGGLAIAASLALLAWTSKHSPEAGFALVSVTSPTRPALPWARGLNPLAGRRQPQLLVVPPPVLPLPLPPQQAWPELPPATIQPTFTDLDSDYWAWPLLADLAQRNLVAGFPDGAFRPDAPMTRAEFAVQLARLFTLSFERSRLPAAKIYRDVAVDHWAYGGVQRSMQMGFLSGYPDATFLPDQSVSRIDVIVALASGLMLKSSSSPAVVLKGYRDQSQVPPWAIRPLVAATEAGLVVDYPNLSQLSPNRPASRAEVAAMLHRALVYTGTLKDVPFPYVVELPQANP